MIGQSQAEIRKVQERIQELKQNWPAHTPPPSMLLELEELEDKLQELLHQEGEIEDG